MKRLSYANVIATLALFVALGGGAYAATQLPKNSVGAKQLKSGAVTPPKLNKAAKESLTGKPGAKGDPGPKGDPGAKGDTGPSDAYASRLLVNAIVAESTNEELLNLDLPAGSYVIESKLTAFASESEMLFHCSLYENEVLIDETQASAPNNGEVPIVNLATLRLQGAGQVVLKCSGEGSGGEWEVKNPASLIATKVGTLHAPN